MGKEPGLLRIGKFEIFHRKILVKIKSFRLVSCMEMSILLSQKLMHFFLIYTGSILSHLLASHNLKIYTILLF